MPVIEHQNILFFLFDSLSYSNAEQMVRSGDLPALAGLHSGAALFTRCYTPCPQSSPARASLFTGLDPSVHGLWTNGVALPQHEQTFPHRLKQAGYATYLAGRNQLAGVSRWTTEQPRTGDYTRIDWAHGPLHRSRQNEYLKWLQHTAPEFCVKLFATQANPDKTQATAEQRTAIDHLPEELSFNYWVGDRVDERINNTAVAKPFFAIAGFCVGNGMGAEPQTHGDGEGLNKTALQQADAAIGRSIAQLRENNRAKETVVIVAAARGNCNKAGDEMTERAIKVPLLIYQANTTPQVVDTAISTIDIAPTVLSIANCASGPRSQGSTLFAADNKPEVPQKPPLTRLRTVSAGGERNWQTSVTSIPMKLVVQHSTDMESRDRLHLYNLDTDPDEQTNLAADAAYATELENMIDLMIDTRCALEDRTEPRIAEF